MLQRSDTQSGLRSRLPDTSDITVLIVAYKSGDTISRCLSSLASQTRRPSEVIVLENGSPAGNRVSAEDVPDDVRLVESDENIGFAAGNNRIASIATTEWIALLNPDAFPRADWIEQFEQARLRYPGVAIFGSTQLAAGRAGVLDGAGDCYHALGLPFRSGYGRVFKTVREGEVFAACGAATIIRRDLFEALGGFDERFFCYNEDVDLGYRARLLGYKTIQLSDAIVEHVGYGSSGRRSEFATYYGVRNRLWVFMKNTPSWLFWLLLPGHAAATFLLWLSAFRFGLGGAYFRAIRDGISGRADMLASRVTIQAQRQVSVMSVARMMSWSPADLFTRKSKVRPVDPYQPSPDS